MPAPGVRVRAPKENRWPEHSRHRRPCQLASGAIRHNFSFHTFLFRPATHSLVPNISPPSIVSTTMTEVAELKKPSTIGAAPASALPAPAASASLVPDPKPPAAGGMCYWPDQSCDSLPPLPGKVAAGLVGGRGMEFSVNEECEFWDIFTVVFVFLLLRPFLNYFELWCGEGKYCGICARHVLFVVSDPNGDDPQAHKGHLFVFILSWTEWTIQYNNPLTAFNFYAIHVMCSFFLARTQAPALP